MLYKDVSKVVAVFSYCVAGISPELKSLMVGKKKKQYSYLKLQTIYDEILLGLVTQCRF